jgi:hypothetical protein
MRRYAIWPDPEFDDLLVATQKDSACGAERTFRRPMRIRGASRGRVLLNQHLCGFRVVVVVTSQVSLHCGDGTRNGVSIIAQRWWQISSSDEFGDHFTRGRPIGRVNDFVHDQ